MMLSTARVLRASLLRPIIPLASTSRGYSSGPGTDRGPVNDPLPNKSVQNVSATNAVPVSASGLRDAPVVESVADTERQRVTQAPNRLQTWSRSQRPRAEAMVGPRFEQTIMEYQPQPQAAIELTHKQPVRWTEKRVVSCDGGGGPLGHPKIFINLDKPKINWCTYCGLPFAHEHHRKFLESLPSTTYPLVAQGDAAEVGETQRVTADALGQR